MSQPYTITAPILKSISSISEKLGEVTANYLQKPSPLLRRQNRIKTIHSSLSIEGNTLSEEKVTALIDNKRVVGPRKDILEVLNANKAYNQIDTYNPLSEKSFKAAHRYLMNGLIENAGKYRTESAGIMHGTNMTHVAPPHNNVPTLMSNLFKYLRNQDELVIIRSCVFHYEMEFIHPFSNGNGRMGRLWQSVILMQEYPVFAFLPIESLVFHTQDDYYRALSASDQMGHSTLFIQYMLKVIDQSLGDLLNFNSRTLSARDRLDYFLSQNIITFSRKDYMNVFKDISTSTASRDLSKGVEMGIFGKSGDKNQTLYQIIKKEP